MQNSRRRENVIVFTPAPRSGAVEPLMRLVEQIAATSFPEVQQPENGAPRLRICQCREAVQVERLLRGGRHRRGRHVALIVVLPSHGELSVETQQVLNGARPPRCRLVVVQPRTARPTPAVATSPDLVLCPPLKLADAARLATLLTAAAAQQLHLRHARENQRLRHELHHLRFALDQHAIVAVTNAAGTIVDVNDKFCDVSQYTRDELIGRDHRIINSGWHDRAFWSRLWRTISRGEVWSGEVCNRARDGSHYWVQTTIVPFRNRRGRISKHIAIRTDITHRRQIEDSLKEAQQELERRVAERTQALRISRERYALAARGANDGLWDWDLVTNEIYYAERWKAMLGYDQDEIGNTPDAWLDRVHPADLQQLLTDIEVHRQVASDHFQNEHRLRRRDGSYRWMLCRALVVRDKDGHAIRFVGSIADITTRRAAEERLRYKSLHDELTDLPNRSLFNERLNDCIRRTQRDGRYTFALLFLDLDRFKIINDSLGHDIGDELLKGAARRIHRAVTERAAEADSAGARHTVARMGGDEFTVILDGVGDADGARGVAQAIQHSLCKPFRIGPHEVFTSASIGIKLSRPLEEDEGTGPPVAEVMLRDADTAMYNAKTKGKAQHALFGHTMHQRARNRMELEHELHRALDRKQLDLHYQPIIALETGEIRGFESLLRWQHPTRGAISPADFIPIAEELGIIVEVGAWALRRACEQLRDWQRRLPMAGPLSMSVNLSRRQLVEPNFVELVERTLDETGVGAMQLNLEITESLIVGDPESFTRILGDLRELGVSLHMDDFGTGHSSLSCLHSFPLHGLKIDRAFIRNMGQRTDYAAVVQAIVMLAHNLHMRVIAEGVELPEQIAQLQALECDDAQGYLLSAPLPAAAAEDYLCRPPDLARSA